MSREDARAQARFVAFSIAIAISLLFTAPHVVWKFMGQKRATELVKRWEAEDARGRPPGSFVPVWNVKLSGYLSSHTVRVGRQLLHCFTLSQFTHLSASHYHNPCHGFPNSLSSGCLHARGKDAFSSAITRADDGQWINGPADSGPHNGVPASYQGYQHPATYGDIPLYGVPRGPLPPYVSDDQRTYSDEKAGL
jgi:hypothetical protein